MINGSNEMNGKTISVISPFKSQEKVVLIAVQTFSVNITTMISMRSLVINISINQVSILSSF